MSSFATIYGVDKMSGGRLRKVLSNNQYLYLSEMFPYFEKNGEKMALEAIYCDKVCSQLDWKKVPIDPHAKSYNEFKYIGSAINGSYSIGNYGHGDFSIRLLRDTTPHVESQLMTFPSAWNQFVILFNSNLFSTFRC